MERNAWMVFRSLADSHGVATVSHESLRAALLCAPGSQKAAQATVSRTVLCLRLSTWIDQIGYRRHPRTGFSLAASYTVRTEPLSFAAACLGNEDYLPLLERGLEHAHVTVRQLARDILDQAMRHPDELAQLPLALQEEVKRLHQQAHSSGDGSDGGGVSRGDESDPHISSPAPAFPKPPQKFLQQYVQYKTKSIKSTYVPHATNGNAGAGSAGAFQAAGRRSTGLPVGPLAGTVCGTTSGRAGRMERSLRGRYAVRDAAAYLFGLIRKALQGTFRL
ncbi:MAG: hypothetical protein LBJ59_05000 [Zoogloeaceae bacterium]|nr:hypothetical protein [Zoogloeaceae bacterium]